MVKKGMTPETAATLRKERGIEETKLQKIRVKKGISQSELSEMAGVPKRTIQYYEHEPDKINGARLHTLCKLSNSLNCKITDLLESDDLIKLYNKVK